MTSADNFQARKAKRKRLKQVSDAYQTTVPEWIQSRSSREAAFVSGASLNWKHLQKTISQSRDLHHSLRPVSISRGFQLTPNFASHPLQSVSIKSCRKRLIQIKTIETLHLHAALSVETWIPLWISPDRTPKHNPPGGPANPERRRIGTKNSTCSANYLQDAC